MKKAATVWAVVAPSGFKECFCTSRESVIRKHYGENSPYRHEDLWRRAESSGYRVEQFRLLPVKPKRRKNR